MSTLRSLLVAVLLPAVVRAQDSSVTSPLPDWGPYASGMQGRLVATPADATASPFSVEIGERHWLDGGTEANPCTSCYNVWVASFVGSTVQSSAANVLEGSLTIGTASIKVSSSASDSAGWNICSSGRTPARAR